MRVNLVAPGWIPVERHDGVDTGGYAAQVPLGRTGTPEEIAGALARIWRASRSMTSSDAPT